MTLNLKNKGTLFSSKEKKVHLFLWLDVNLVRYGDFVIFPILSFLSHYLYLEIDGPPRYGIKKTLRRFHDPLVVYSQLFLAQD